MKPSLQVRPTRQLALTPELRQAIRLLQLSTQELQQEVQQMLTHNPMLEVDDTVAPAAEPQPDPAPASEPGDWDPPAPGDTWGSGPAVRGVDAGDDAHDRLGAAPSLQAHLRQQLHGMRLADEDAAAVDALIDSVDDNGYLDGTLEDIADHLAHALELHDAQAVDALLAQLRCGLRWLQSLEPTGVGAADLAECLQLQLHAQADSPARALALTLVSAHLDLLARRDWRKLAAATGASETQLQAAQALVLACDPKPGRAFAATVGLMVVPDVVVHRGPGGWQARLNPNALPRLRLAQGDALALRGHDGLSRLLKEARGFLHHVQQRGDTLLRVSQAIAEHQSAFLDHGAVAMKPLVLRQIADELGLHESTLSRVTSAKYMATPHGTFELKHFFGAALATTAGSRTSATAVRALISQWVAAEDAAQPLSDGQIAEQLERHGIQVARRTVAKYREALQIGPAALRKR